MQTINLQAGESLKLVLGDQEIVLRLGCAFTEDDGLTLEVRAANANAKLAYVGGRSVLEAEYGEVNRAGKFLNEKGDIIGGAAKVVRLAPMDL